jgi:prolyl oligopeptidase
MVRFLRAVLVLAFFAPHIASAQAPLPPTPVREVTDDYFGTKVVDPYRWLENQSDPEVVAWMKAQNDHTRAILANISGRDKLLDRIKALDNANVVVSGLQSWGGRYFYLKTEPGSDNRKLCVRDGVKGTERVLIDPQKMTTADGKHFSIDYFQPSLDGKYVAYGVSPGGSEDSVMHVVESATGTVLPDTIDRAQFGSPSWLPGSRSFYYIRTQKLEKGAPPTAKFQKLRAYRHTLGSDPDKEPAVFGYEVNPDVRVSEDDVPVVAFSPGAPGFVVALVVHGVQREFDVYSLPFEATPGAKSAWKHVATEADDVTGLDVHGDQIYLLSHADASRYKVLRTSLANPDIKHAELVVPPSEVVVVNIIAGADALYIQDLDGGIGRLRRLRYGAGAVESVKLPFDGAIQSLFANPIQAGAWLELVSWIKSPLWYALDSKSGKLSDTTLVPNSPVDYSQVEAEEVKAKSADGTMATERMESRSIRCSSRRCWHFSSAAAYLRWRMREAAASTARTGTWAARN